MAEQLDWAVRWMRAVDGREARVEPWHGSPESAVRNLGWEIIAREQEGHGLVLARDGCGVRKVVGPLPCAKIAIVELGERAAPGMA